MVKQKEISVRQYAKDIGVDEAAIRRAIKEGKIKKGVKYITRKVKGKDEKVPVIIPTLANKEYGDLKSVKKPQRGVSKARIAKDIDGANTGKKDPEKKKGDLPDETELPDLSFQELLSRINIHDQLPYSEIIRRRELLGAAQDKMKLQQMEGLLVEKAVVDKELYDLANNLKKNFLNIPNRCISLLRSAANDVDAINLLTMEINSVLESFSNQISQ